MSRPLGKLAGEAIFGASDGLMSILGPVMFFASRNPRLVFPVAFMGAVSAATSMGAGQRLSEQQDDTAGPVVIGGATFAGSVLPAVPYLFTAGLAAVLWSAGVCVAVALGVGHLRSWRRHRYLETVGVLAFVAAVTVGCNLVLPGGVVLCRCTEPACGRNTRQ